MSYTSNLAMMDWADIKAPTLHRLTCQLQRFKANLNSPSLLWACISAVERLLHKVRQLKENVDNLSPSLPLQASISATTSWPFSAQRKGNHGHMPCATLWFCLCDCAEDMRKWDSAPTLALEVCVHELWEKVVKKGPSRKITALVAVEQFPRCSRWAMDPSPLSGTDPMDLRPCGFEPHAFYHGRTMLVCSSITPVNSPCSIA